MACDAMLGKGITNFPCDLPKGHDGPHATPSVMKSVQDRQAWEIETAKRQSQPGPGLPWENVDGFEHGVQKPHPRQYLKCQFCPVQVAYEDMLTHVSSHIGQPNPALVPPLSAATTEPPPGTPQPAPNGVIGGSSANALVEHISKHQKAPVPPQMFMMPPYPYGYAPPPPPGVASGVTEAVQHMAEVVDPAAYRVQGPLPTADQVVQEYFDYGPEQQTVSDGQLLSEVQTLLNRYSRENASNTPDFILAEFLMSCLRAFEQCTNARDNWYTMSQPLEPSSTS